MLVLGFVVRDFTESYVMEKSLGLGLAGGVRFPRVTGIAQRASRRSASAALIFCTRLARAAPHFPCAGDLHTVFAKTGSDKKEVFGFSMNFPASKRNINISKIAIDSSHRYLLSPDGRASDRGGNLSTVYYACAKRKHVKEALVFLLLVRTPGLFGERVRARCGSRFAMREIVHGLPHMPPRSPRINSQ